MVVMEVMSAAPAGSPLACVMEKKVRILTLWSVEAFLFLLLGGSRILVNTWMLHVAFSSWLDRFMFLLFHADQDAAGVATRMSSAIPRVPHSS
jgi:hypothetical protein